MEPKQEVYHMLLAPYKPLVNPNWDRLTPCICPLWVPHPQNARRPPNLVSFFPSRQRQPLRLGWAQ